jgi:murein DD-endopeptidase MepM/ murein hydrolase activator NlpD
VAEFGTPCWQASVLWDVEQAQQVVVIGDGAAWSDGLAQAYWPHALSIGITPCTICATQQRPCPLHGRRDALVPLWGAPRLSRALLLAQSAMGCGSSDASSTSTTSSMPMTPSPTASPTPSMPLFGLPYRAGVTVSLGLPEKTNPSSRLHDSNYSRINDETGGPSYNLGNYHQYDASLDMGFYGHNDYSPEFVYPLASGTVLAVQPSCNAVLIDYGDGWWSIYLHLTDIQVAHSQMVTTATPIGKPTMNVSGCDQMSSFQHVHFAFLKNGSYVSMVGMVLCGHTVGTDGNVQGLTSALPNDGATFTVPNTCPGSAPPQPTATPSMRILYQADWSQGTDGWMGSPDWQAQNGAFINDGSNGASLVTAPSILVPFDMTNYPDFIIEAQIQVMNQGFDPGFDFMVRL